jgi:hypothetical protein
MRRRARTVAFVIVVGLLGGCATPLPAAPTAEAAPRLWVVTGGWFDWIRFEARPIALRLFRTPPSVILGTYHLRAGTVGGPTPAGHQDAFAWPSAHRFAETVRTSSYFLRGMHVAMYDPERWGATPIVEQRDPVRWFERFARNARRHVPIVMLSPHPNLTAVPGALCGADGGSIYEAFLRCGLAGAAARQADIVEIQAQGLERDPSEYRAFVLEAARQARTINPHVEVIAGLSAMRGVTVADLYDAWRSVTDVVDGYYLAITDRDRVDEAIAFLRRLPIP